MAFRVVDGLVLTDSLEVDIVDHCNLACRACSHLSPIAPKSIVDAEALGSDLSTLAKVLHAKRLKVLGGEPLLHPKLTEVLSAVRGSGVSDTVALVTNGHLLDRLTAEHLDLLDEVVVSDYSSARVPKEVLERARERVARSQSSFVVNQFNQFREMFSAKPAESPALVQRIFQTCEIVHVYSCFSVRDGVFYKCPQARSVHKFLHRRPSVDGIAIADDDGFSSRMIAYLGANRPLAACRNCVGTAGTSIEHAQVARAHWREQFEREYEALIDWGWLEGAERNETPSRQLFTRTSGNNSAQLDGASSDLTHVDREA